MRASEWAAARRRSTSATNPIADRGGVSRPSSSAWTRTAGTPVRAARSAIATRCRSLAWTPPGPIRLMMWRRPPGRAARRHASSRAGRSKKLPSAIAASIRGRSWRTGRPAPRLRWPTSELPIWPGGRPTASSDARRTACGHSRRRARQVGIGAAAIASVAGSPPIPKPSRTTRTMGRGLGAVPSDGIAAFSGWSVSVSSRVTRPRRGRWRSARPVPRSRPSRRP